MAIDPFLLDVAADLVSTGVASAATVGGRLLSNRISKKLPAADLSETLTRDARVESILQKAATSIAKKVKLSDDSQTEALRRALVSPEADAVISQVYSWQITNGGVETLSSLRERFIKVIDLYGNLGPKEVPVMGGILFDAIVSTCERYLRIAIGRGNVEAKLARLASRDRYFVEQIAAIRQGLEVMLAQQKASVEEILRFETQYRNEVGRRHGFIIPPHLNDSQKIPLDRLYVLPHFATVSKKTGQRPSILDLSKVLQQIERTVVLGNPGGGKSTFANKLCHYLSLNYADRPVGQRSVTPIFVTLRDYGVENRERRASILEFIEETAKSTYQISPPMGAFEYLLTNGRILIIFDGLDELLESKHRRKVSDDVESFCSQYPSVPVLVTSREVGYEQAPLDDNSFDVYKLNAFTDEQVQEYAKKWFAIDPTIPTHQCERKTQGFLRESETVPDLRSNPLILGLMCNIYREENYIPRNRPEVYRKCAEMLFDRWDRKREIPVRFRFENEFRPAMAYLAHWIYSTETLRGGVTEEQLVRVTSNYLLGKRFEDEDEAEAAARDFVEFCRGRAWVFTDVGSSAGGESLYQFTHRTFLEYFAALYLARTIEAAVELAKHLLPKIQRREWDIVSQLAFQIKSSESEGAADKLLNTLLIHASEANNGEIRWNILSFVARALEFVVPSPSTTRRLTSTCIAYGLDWGVARGVKAKEAVGGEIGTAGELLAPLFAGSNENYTPIWNALSTDLVNEISSPGSRRALLAAEVGLNLARAAHNSILTEASRQYWITRSKEFHAHNLPVLRELAQSDRKIASDLWLFNSIPLQEIEERFGLPAIFAMRDFVMINNIQVVAPMAILARSLHHGLYPEQDLNRIMEDLEYFGKRVSLTRETILAPRHVDDYGRHWNWVQSDFRHSGALERKPLWGLLSEESLWGAFLLDAIGTEYIVEHHRHVADKAPFIGPFEKVLSARVLPRDERSLSDLPLEEIGLRPEQVNWIRGWLNNEFHLIGALATKTGPN